MAPIPVKLSVDKKSFACGTVRNAFKARALSGLKARYVLKRYKQNQVADIEALFGTLDNHTRKCVQIHSLARYYAMQLEKEALSQQIMEKPFCIQKCMLTRLKVIFLL